MLKTIVAVLSIVSVALCQNSSDTTASNTAVAVNSTLPTTLPTTDGNNTAPNSANVTEPPLVTCTPGISVGSMLIRQPNSTSMFTIGNTYNVSWDWTALVKVFPQYVDVYLQLSAHGVQETWKNKIISKQSVSPRWFMWTPDAVVDGEYRLMLVPDGKMRFGVPLDKQPCFADGEPIPSVSGTFSISNPRGDLGNYPDPFPPNSAERTCSQLFLFVLCTFIYVASIF